MKVAQKSDTVTLYLAKMKQKLQIAFVGKYLICVTCNIPGNGPIMAELDKYIQNNTRC